MTRLGVAHLFGNIIDMKKDDMRMAEIFVLGLDPFRLSEIAIRLNALVTIVNDEELRRTRS